MTVPYITPKMGYLMTAATIQQLPDDDERAAAAWFMEQENAELIQPSQLADLDANIYPVLWIEIDCVGLPFGWENLPAEITSDETIAALRQYSANGGSLYLSNMATQLTVPLGFVPSTMPLTTYGNGEGGTGTDVWTINPYLGWDFRNGSIDDISIWNEAKSLDEIQTWQPEHEPDLDILASRFADDFRDPYFFRNGDNAYIIVGSSKNGVGTTTLHRYNPLTGMWSNDGDLFFTGSSAAEAGTFWEMPNITPMPDGRCRNKSYAHRHGSGRRREEPFAKGGAVLSECLRRPGRGLCAQRGEHDYRERLAHLDFARGVCGGRCLQDSQRYRAGQRGTRHGIL